MASLQVPSRCASFLSRSCLPPAVGNIGPKLRLFYADMLLVNLAGTQFSQLRLAKAAVLLVPAVWASQAVEMSEEAADAVYIWQTQLAGLGESRQGSISNKWEGLVLQSCAMFQRVGRKMMECL